MSRQFLNEWEAKENQLMVCCELDLSRTLSKSLVVIANNSDWFIVLFASFVIGRGD